jgi:hypothetical protein
MKSKHDTCSICGLFPDDCICLECPECGTAGDPRCYAEHGLVRSLEQIKSLSEQEAKWKADAEAEAAFWAERKDDEWPE